MTPPVRVIRVGGLLSLRLRPRPLLVGTGSALLALAMAVLTIGTGDFPIGPADVLRTLAGGGSSADTFIVDQIRLPRVLTALLVGGALALAGAVFQSLVRNPLGSPDMLGFTQGAAAGALVVIIVIGGGSAAVAGGATVGGLATGALIHALAWRKGLHGSRLILVGVGVAAFLSGINGYLLTRARLQDAQSAVLWLTGSLDGAGWGVAALLSAAMAVLVPVLLIGCGRGLRALDMGEDAATSLGVRVGRQRLALLVSAVLLTSVAAAAAGPVSFVALTAPQLARRLTRAPGPNLLPSLCTGAALLVGADWLAQRLIADNPLPVGVVTGVLGGGYLVGLLAAERRAGRI